MLCKLFKSNCFSYIIVLEQDRFILNVTAVGERSGSVYIDFSKVFVKVSHSILLHKLSAYNVLLQWLDSYLTKRIQNVKIKDFFSFSLELLSGVPQGSGLGSLFFYLYNRYSS